MNPVKRFICYIVVLLGLAALASAASWAAHPRPPADTRNRTPGLNKSRMFTILPTWPLTMRRAFRLSLLGGSKPMWTFYRWLTNAEIREQLYIIIAQQTAILKALGNPVTLARLQQELHQANDAVELSLSQSEKKDGPVDR